ncbi:hypothetical protein ACK8P5_21360 [Paenibacillus sp. EC2-1]|uniref:hypothetical protein n=1 Tax=Paenibacillus sp. EC2-1 TaxID=3388665 RepID=UPI003BEEFED0
MEGQSTRNFFMILSVFLGIITLSACSEQENVNEASDISSISDVRRIQNLEEAVSYSDLVVIGTVDKVHPATKRNMNADKSDPFYAVYTNLDIKVDNIILGNITQRPQNMFTMKQAGGVYDGIEYATYEPILEEGKTYLFFLATFDKYGLPEEPYTLVGTDEIVVPVEEGIVKFNPSLYLTNRLETKQIKDKNSTDHNVAINLDDVIPEIIKINEYLPEPKYDIDNYLPDPVDTDVDLNSLK